MANDTDETDREGVGLCTYRIPRDLHWIFREQKTSDYGVDAQVETKDGTEPTGRLLGLQIKTGPYWFNETYEDGWIFRPKKRHIQYWLGHSLPMFLLLVDLGDEAIYWQEISEATLDTGPRGGIVLRVPKTNVLAVAAEPWRKAADAVAAAALAHYDDNVEHLSPATANAVRRASEQHPGQAALLAAHLARGRRTPELTALTILASKPPWFTDNQAKGYLALANYALGHEVTDVAVETLVEVARADPPSSQRHLTNAAFVIHQSNPERARSLLDEARSAAQGFDARIELCELVLAHPIDSANPIDVPAELEARLVTIDDDPVVIAFLARQRERTNHINDAAELAERALELDPDAWQNLEALSAILARRSLGENSQTTDMARSIELAERALDQLHRWDGPTEQVLRTLLKSLFNAALLSKILLRTLPPDAGQARDNEAGRPEVILAAEVAARALERTALADSLLERLPDGVDKRLAVLRRLPATGERDDVVQLWIAIIDELDEGRPEQLLQAVLHLADLGIDRSQKLDMMVAKGILLPVFQNLAAALASATTDLDVGLPSLRLLADSHPMAAQKLVEVLTKSNRLDDAEQACEATFVRFSQPQFLLERAHLLRRLQREPDAERVANDALATATLSTIGRMSAHHLLARIAARAAEGANGTGATAHWRRAQVHFNECVSGADGLPASVEDVWGLVLTHFRLADYDRARETLRRHDPEIRDKNDAVLWYRIIVTAEISDAAFARMIDLADRFDDDPMFSGALLSAVVGRTRDATGSAASAIDPRTPLSDELRAQAFAALASHVERHGDESPFQVIQAATTEGLIAQMTELMRRDESPLIDMSEMIARVRAPVGMLATMIGRPYSSVLVQRHLGYFIAGASATEDDDADESAASTALNKDVVVDASSLLVSSLMAEFANSRAQFRNLLVPAASQQDILSGRLDLDGRAGASGWLRYDAERDSIAIAEPDIESEVAALRRFSLIEQALTHARVIQGVSLDNLGELEIERSESWLSPIALAKDQGVALWSDDLAIRRLARSVGVDAFGTTTLLQLRAERKVDEAGSDSDKLQAVLEERRNEVLRALSERVVDVPGDVSTLIEQARRESWAPGVAVATFGRPGWWQLAVTPWDDLQQVLAAISADEMDRTGWQSAAMWGVTRIVPEDASATAVLLACVAMVSAGSPANIEHAARMLQLAEQIATRRGAHSPLEFLTQAATELAGAGLVDDPQTKVEELRDAVNDLARSAPAP